MKELEFFKVFGKVVKSNKPKVTFIEMNKLTLPQGIYVPGDLCYKWLFDEMKEKNINPNSTFYQSWINILSKTRFELFLDQIRHYASTYGTNFQSEAWLPEHSELPEFPYKELKVLEEISEEQAVEEIKNLAYSNIAMSQEVLDFLYSFKNIIDVYNVKNRMLKVMLIDDNYKFVDGQECLLYILYKFFGLTLVIKNKETYGQIIYGLGGNSESINKVLTFNKEVLASVFYRNKDIFMQFKHNKSLSPIINKIRKLATKYHKPMAKSPWLRLPELSAIERIRLYDKASIFKLVQMFNALNNPTGYYIIRNGKAWYRENISRKVKPFILNELLGAIVSKLPKVESVCLPKNINLAMPTSEKNFIGDIPLGSSIECSGLNTMVGIYWKNEWGAYDLDLHCRTIDGETIGWNSQYYDEDVVFSGDMTFADPEAAEVIWFKNGVRDCIVSVSEYNGESNYKYQIFVAQEKATNFDKNYMVDPRSILYKAEMNFSNRRDVTLGYIHNGEFIFHSCNIGKGCVPNKIRKEILNHLVQCSYLKLKDVLEMANIEISDESEIKIESKGDLINFFNL